VKYLAQRYLVSYLRFVYKAHNKNIFNIKKINMEKFAHSLGLPSAPSINIKGQNAESSDEEK
jgi:ATP-dependent RNA helicase DDX10/DBP4